MGSDETNKLTDPTHEIITDSGTEQAGGGMGRIICIMGKRIQIKLAGSLPGTRVLDLLPGLPKIEQIEVVKKLGYANGWDEHLTSFFSHPDIDPEVKKALFERIRGWNYFWQNMSEPLITGVIHVLSSGLPENNIFSLGDIADAMGFESYDEERRHGSQKTIESSQTISSKTKHLSGKDESLWETYILPFLQNDTVPVHLRSRFVRGFRIGNFEDPAIWGKRIIHALDDPTMPLEVRLVMANNLPKNKITIYPSDRGDPQSIWKFVLKEDVPASVRCVVINKLQPELNYGTVEPVVLDDQYHHDVRLALIGKVGGHQSLLRSEKTKQRTSPVENDIGEALVYKICQLQKSSYQRDTCFSFELSQLAESTGISVLAITHLVMEIQGSNGDNRVNKASPKFNPVLLGFRETGKFERMTEEVWENYILPLLKSPLFDYYFKHHITLYFQPPKDGSLVAVEKRIGELRDTEIPAQICEDLAHRMPPIDCAGYAWTSQELIPGFLMDQKVPCDIRLGLAHQVKWNLTYNRCQHMLLDPTIDPQIRVVLAKKVHHLEEGEFISPGENEGEEVILKILMAILSITSNDTLERKKAILQAFHIPLARICHLPSESVGVASTNVLDPRISFMLINKILDPGSKDDFHGYMSDVAQVFDISELAIIDCINARRNGETLHEFKSHLLHVDGNSVISETVWEDTVIPYLTHENDFRVRGLYCRFLSTIKIEGEATGDVHLEKRLGELRDKKIQEGYREEMASRIPLLPGSVNLGNPSDSLTQFLLDTTVPLRIRRECLSKITDNLSLSSLWNLLLDNRFDIPLRIQLSERITDISGLDTIPTSEPPLANELVSTLVHRCLSIDVVDTDRILTQLARLLHINSNILLNMYSLRASLTTGIFLQQVPHAILMEVLRHPTATTLDDALKDLVHNTSTIPGFTSVRDANSPKLKPKVPLTIYVRYGHTINYGMAAEFLIRFFHKCLEISSVFDKIRIVPYREENKPLDSTLALPKVVFDPVRGQVFKDTVENHNSGAVVYLSHSTPPQKEVCALVSTGTKHDTRGEKEGRCEDHIDLGFELEDFYDKRKEGVAFRDRDSQSQNPLRDISSYELAEAVLPKFQDLENLVLNRFREKRMADLSTSSSRSQ